MLPVDVTVIFVIVIFLIGGQKFVTLRRLEYEPDIEPTFLRYPKQTKLVQNQ